MYNTSLENLKERGQFVKLGIYGDNIKIDFKEVWYEDAEWIRLALDKLQWRGLVNMLMNVWIS